MPPGPPPLAPGGPGPQSNPLNAFLAAFLSDVSAELGPGMQCVDIAATALKIALRATEFQKREKTVAVLQSCLNTLTTLLNAQVSGQGGTPPATPQASGVDAGAADADAQPGAASSGDNASGE
jgi:hypothetical protein